MKTLAAILITLCCAAASAQTYVRPYTDRNGNYHEGHYRSAPNEHRYDNYNSQSNGYNPYTGKRGTQRDEYSAEPEYNKGRHNTEREPGRNNCLRDLFTGKCY